MDKLMITNDPRITDLRNWLKNLQEFQLDSYFEVNVLGRSYDYIKSINVIKIEAKNIIATITGTSIYQLNLTLENENIWGSCSCPYDKSCKHLAALILSLIELDL